jgi:hypothetical protein
MRIVKTRSHLVALAAVVLLSACAPNSGGGSDPQDGSVAGSSGTGGAMGGNAVAGGGRGGATSSGGTRSGGTLGADAGAGRTPDAAPELPVLFPELEAPPDYEWKRVESDGVYAGLWASSLQEIYAAGQAGRIVHLKDGNWVSENSTTTDNLVSVWGSGPGDVYVGSRGNYVLHSSGNGKWDSIVLTDVPDAKYIAVHGTGPADVYIGSPLRHFKGSGWQLADPLGLCRLSTLIWAADSSHVYAGGVGSEAGTLCFSTGNDVWKVQRFNSTDSAGAFWGSSAQNLFAATSSQLFHSTGDGSWRLIAPFVRLGNFVITSLWGDGKTLFVASNSSLSYMDKYGKRQLILSDVNVEVLLGFGRTDLIFAGGRGIWHGKAKTN